MDNIKGDKTILADPMMLAYIGDAVFELQIRKHVTGSGITNPNKLHRMAVQYVKASAQAAAIKKIFEELPEDQQRLVKRARNHKSSSRPKNADPVEYKWATAFEALVGYLYLSEDYDGLNSIVGKAIGIIENEAKD